MGQSIAGINDLGVAAATVWPPLGPALRAAALAYGLPVWGFGVYWLILAIAVTLRPARTQLPFTLGWWAFTFPVGVLTTGTYAPYGQTHAPLFAGAGLLLLALLAALWMLVATRTARHAIQHLRAVQSTPDDGIPAVDRLLSA